MTDTRSLEVTAAALDGIVSGEIRSINQILKLEKNHALTNIGAVELIKRFTLRDKPEQRGGRPAAGQPASNSGFGRWRSVVAGFCLDHLAVDDLQLAPLERRLVQTDTQSTPH